MTHRGNWWSTFEAVLGWRLQTSVSPAKPAKAAHQATALGGETNIWPRVSRERPDLLLMRLEALQLDLTQVEALMPTEFRALARVCDYCQDKVRCERDLVYEAAGKAVSWEHYCPNAYQLRAMGLLQTV
ncbi:hypothetical protein [Allomesorhizobium camelthorni]|uniref:Uncharacterized protein n=1 Tax=Allomesorhizobium camelthorni TaxID=475069 RepID=A0A6G4WK65_9HYPH|nr:hypothetical protein [Mesorhizobium camelthorni]NGO54477.1 hypothetical protein [Mesorhizobium camelthorni]